MSRGYKAHSGTPVPRGTPLHSKLGPERVHPPPLLGAAPTLARGGPSAARPPPAKGGPLSCTPSLDRLDRLDQLLHCSLHRHCEHHHR